MNVKIADIMAKRVISAARHSTVAHVRSMMERNRINAVPVTDSEKMPIGIITSTDLSRRRLKDETPISRIMTKEVKTIPAYNDASAAARAMRRGKMHHLIVTHEKQVVGIVSTFDLLKLVEDHRFVMKGAPAHKNKSRKSQR